MTNAPRIPVVMFHTVDRPDSGWLWDELTCPVDLFAKKIESFQSRGYIPASLDDIHEHQVLGSVKKDRRVVLTFDDGYLDNWVYVYPLLKRAGWKGIVYVNPEFVDPSEEPRSTLEDVWNGKCSENDLQSRGFLNWAEIELLDRSGVLEIGSHSMSHTWYPTGPVVQDFHRPGLITPWLAWNARPDRKPFYRLEDQSGFVPWGTPIHQSGRSLGIRRYFPDPDVAPAVTEHVATKGGAAFFDDPGFHEELQKVTREADQGRGREETDDEMMARFDYEINEADRILSGRLGRDIPHFCWPGGAYCEDAWKVVNNTNIKTLTIKRSDLKRWNESDPRFIRRISEYRHYSLLGKHHETTDPNLLTAACDVELGRALSRFELRARKLLDGFILNR